jgi:hypothetical protein
MWPLLRVYTCFVIGKCSKSSQAGFEDAYGFGPTCASDWKIKQDSGAEGREISVFFVIDKKGKAVPLQAWSGPDGFRKLKFPYFITTAHDGGKVVSLTHRPRLPHRKCTWYSFLLEAEPNPGP